MKPLRLELMLALSPATRIWEGENILDYRIIADPSHSV